MKFESEVVPLTSDQIIEMGDEMVVTSIPNRQTDIEGIRKWNVGILQDPEAVVNLHIACGPGDLGDMIRGAHWIPVFRNIIGRKPLIFSNYPQLFNSFERARQDKLRKSLHLTNDYWFYCLPTDMHLLLEPNTTYRRQAEDFEYLSVESRNLEMRRPFVQHNLHRLQLYSYLAFGELITEFPHAEISLSPQVKRAGDKVYQDLDLDESALPVLVYPDASALLFDEKKWYKEDYIQTLEELYKTWTNQINITLLTGISHPGETYRIAELLDKQKIPYKLVGKVKNLGSFASLVQNFAQRKAVMLGTESMAAGHLAPILGIWSVVLGWGSKPTISEYRPVEEGCTVVMSKEDYKYPSSEEVLQALNPRIEARLESLRA